MSLQDLVKTGIDFSDTQAVDRALSTDAAVEAMVEHQEATRTRATPLELAEEEGDAPADTVDVAPAGDTTPDPDAPLEPPVPIGEEPTPESDQLTPEQKAAAEAAKTAATAGNDARIAELQAELDALRAQNAELLPAKEKSAAAEARAAELAEFIEIFGEDHPTVKRARRENAEADAREARDAERDVVTQTAVQEAAHAKLIPSAPFLKSFYDTNDSEGIAIAHVISIAILNDPKLAGTKAAEAFTPEHYREVEARLLKRFPEAKTKFYNVRVPARREGKVVPITVSQLRGGATPPAGVKASVDQKQLFEAIAADPHTPIDQILEQISRTGTR